ncbi:MAG TPA: mechanosensitive ion channel domain-containing protein [Candidatus Binatia bacterium]|nr:mechanosensitive ion channel domain-containing protein [Candidatus Binatia bacterium]
MRTRFLKLTRCLRDFFSVALSRCSISSRPNFLLRVGMFVVCLVLTGSAAHAMEDAGQASTLLNGLIRVAIATLLLLVVIWLLRRARVWGVQKLQTTAILAKRFPPLLATDLQAHVSRAGQILIRVISAATVLVLGYLWLVYSLEQFPYTASWGERLGRFLFDLVLQFGLGALGALPGLFVVLIIILIARWCARVVNVIFKGVQAGTISLPGLEQETARTTQTLLIFVIWLFALVVAYPYIPGSETEAFKGLSVLIGLMITLGSTGLINQVISGLFVIYSRSVRPQDYVRIGDIEGEVVSIGSLATKLRTPRREEITIPHSVLVGTATTNYSRLAGADGMVITASVTIGYDVPWRQVHGLLLLGASRTRGIRKEPAPRVLQRELSDFYVQYQLLAHLEDGKSRAEVISELHAQIQDAFNEYGTQIMSPHFESQPEKRVFVPKSGWYAAPATPTTSVGVEPTTKMEHQKT